MSKQSKKKKPEDKFCHPDMDSLFHHAWVEQIVSGKFWSDEVFFCAPLYLGLDHAAILLTGGLFALSNAIEIITSLERCAGLVGFTRAALGAIVGLLLKEWMSETLWLM